MDIVSFRSAIALNVNSEWRKCTLIVKAGLKPTSNRELEPITEGFLIEVLSKICNSGHYLRGRIKITIIFNFLAYKPTSNHSLMLLIS